MRLWVVRHAVAMERTDYREKFGPQAADELRPLTEPGAKKMRKQAKGLLTLLPRPRTFDLKPADSSVANQRSIANNLAQAATAVQRCADTRFVARIFRALVPLQAAPGRSRECRCGDRRPQPRPPDFDSISAHRRRDQRARCAHRSQERRRLLPGVSEPDRKRRGSNAGPAHTEGPSPAGWRVIEQLAGEECIAVMAGLFSTSPHLVCEAAYSALARKRWQK